MTRIGVLLVSAVALAVVPWAVGGASVDGPLVTYTVEPATDPASGSIWEVAPSGAGRRLLARGKAFAWSPAGDRIAYTRGRDLFLSRADGTGEEQLTAFAGEQGFAPSWSPDGRTIALLSQTGAPGAAGGPWALVVVDPATRVVRRLADDVAPVERHPPAWAPDSSAVAYSADTGGFQRELAVVAADGSESRRLLTATRDVHEVATAWAPDGSALAVLRASWNPNLPAELWLLTYPDLAERRLAASARDVFAWSPDGGTIAYTPDPNRGCSRCNTDSDIVAVDVATGRKTTLAPSRGDERWPAWSPDGRLLAFVSERDSHRIGGAWNTFYIANADGSCPARLVLLDPGRDRVIQVGWRPGSGLSRRLRCVDLRVTSAAPSALLLGRDGHLRVRVANRGNVRATGTSVTIRIPDGVVADGAVAEHAVCAGVRHVVCRLGTLAPGAARVVRVRLRQQSALGAATLARDGLAPRFLSALATAAAAERERHDADNRDDRGLAVWPCTILGTTGPDQLAGTPGRDLICGRGRPDVIRGLAGDDVLDGSFGADRLFPGKGRDVVYAQQGNDVVHAVDGERDVIFCGPGREVVRADRRDRVARDCDRVERR